MSAMLAMVVLRGVLFLFSLLNAALKSGMDLHRLSVYNYPAESDSRILKWVPRFVSMLFKSLLPGHGSLKQRPAYSLHRIVFHTGMFVSVFCLSYHIDAWEETLPRWVLSYLSMLELPDGFIEYTSLFVIISMLYLIVKRWALTHLRQYSGIWDVILPGVILAPFVSGYLAMTGHETSFALIDDNLDTIHILSGNIFLLAAGFLFCRTVIAEKRCVSCVACVNNCPANALSTQIAGERLIIAYAGQRCIHCGTCMKVCDEGASQLRHVLGIPLPVRKKVLHTSQMAICQTCHAGFVPLNHLEKLQQKNVDYDIGVCPDCRSLSHAQIQKKLLA